MDKAPGGGKEEGGGERRKEREEKEKEERRERRREKGGRRERRKRKKGGERRRRNNIRLRSCTGRGEHCTFSLIAKDPTDGLSIKVVPVIIADAAPLPIEAHLHITLPRMQSSHQSNIAIVTVSTGIFSWREEELGVLMGGRARCVNGRES